MKRKAGIKRVAFLIILIFVILTVKNIIVYATTDTVSVVCNDGNLYKALYNYLNSSKYLYSADSNTYTLNVIEDELENITSLSLNGASISDLTGIETFTYLESLDISSNSISDLSPISSLTSLTTLNASSNSLTTSSLSAISSLTNLTELNLSSNSSISSITNLSNLTNLTKLYLSGNSISSISTIQNFTSLSELDLSKNTGITQIDDAIVSSLTVLNLSGTSITKIKTDDTADMSKLAEQGKNLKALYLANNNIEDLDELFVTESVTSTDGEGNETTEDLAVLRNLEILDLNMQSNTNGINFYDIGLLTNLKELYLQQDEISNLYGITDLENLEYIDLSINEISSLDGIIEYDYDENGNPYVSKALTATEIVMQQNEIEDISLLGELDNIEYLDLSKNKIKDISALENFTFEDNKLHLENQELTMSVYNKTNEKDQYMILYNIMQSVKDESSIIYDEDAEFITEGVTLNQDETYLEAPYYNVIIDSSYFEEDDYDTDVLTVTIDGGVIDGTTLTFDLEGYNTEIDSIFCEDENLYNALYSYLSENISEDTYMVAAPYIINVERWEVSNITTLDLSDKDITSLEGLSNFSNLQTLNLADNNVSDDSEISYLEYLSILYLQNNQLNGNYQSIENLYYLTNLNLSGNSITSLESLKNLLDNQEEDYYTNEITILTLSNNSIEDISIIEELTNLTQLNISGNSITDISCLESNTSLTTLNVSSNEIEDISVLSGLIKLSTLTLSNNKIEDISSLSSLSLTDLDLAGNNITDISALSKQSLLNTLKLSNNKIEDISSLEKLTIKGSCELYSQSLTQALDKDQTGEVTVDLPAIFISATGNSTYGTSSKVYTSSDLSLTNCTLSSDGKSIIINVDELNGKVAEVTIAGGNANYTTFTVAESLEGTITYDIDTKTKENVTATISFNRSNVTITNNDGSNTYTFTENGTFTFEYEDEYGFTDETVAEVTWIDRTAPEIEISYSPSSYTNKYVTVTISADETIQEVDGWDFSNDEMTIITKTFTDNTTTDLEILDEVGNSTTVQITVDKIDKDSPVISGVEDGETYTESVTPVVTDTNLDYITLKKDGSVVSGYSNGQEISDSGTYILTAVDKATNTTEISFTLEIEIDDTITSSKYDVDDTNYYISKVEAGKTVKYFKNNISTEVNYTIVDSKDTEVSDTSTICTGYKLITETNKVYVISVLGDVSGDGKINQTDLYVLSRHIVHLATLTGAYEKAADVVEDDTIKNSDLYILSRVVVGLTSL